MSMVFPGVAEVMASPFLPVSILMRLDFPTLERPMKAYSGNVPAGHFRTSVLLMTNSAFVISILLPFWGFTCGKGSTNFISLQRSISEKEQKSQFPAGFKQGHTQTKTVRGYIQPM